MLNDKQKNHYYRNILLDDFGEKGQERLLNSRVLVVGCGGLASPSLIYLSSIGVGHITIIDDDKVSLSNLPRQILFSNEDISKPKGEVSKRKLEGLNPDVEVNFIQDRLTEDNAKEIIKGFDIVLEVTDNFETKFLVDDVCNKLGIPFVIAGVSDYQGQITTCIPGKSKDFKSLFSTLPSSDKSLVEGVYPPAAGVISNIACSEVIKYLLGIDSLLLNKMMVVDLKKNDFKVVNFPKD